MTELVSIALAWGPDEICRVLPHRAPLLLVDRVDRLSLGRHPRLRAGLRVSGDEPVLRGHFPTRPVWPGAYMVEGLAQAAGLLVALSRVARAGGPEAIEALARGRQPESESASESKSASALEGLLVRTQLRFTSVVEPPAQLDYDLRLRGELGGVLRVDGRVEHRGQTAAEGSLALALLDAGGRARWS